MAGGKSQVRDNRPNSDTTGVLRTVPLPTLLVPFENEGGAPRPQCQAFFATAERLPARRVAASIVRECGVGMSQAELEARYREYAAKCVAIAQGLEHAHEKLALLNMAQAWIALAEQAQKDEAQFVLCETQAKPAE